MKRSTALSLTALITLLSLRPVLAADAKKPRPSPLAGVAALEKPISLTETKIPLGELVQKVAAETDLKLTATRDVADEPVAVVVKELPARELLEQLADLLDFTWVRRAAKPASAPTTAERGKPATAPSAPAFEITQDVAAKQREEALRQAARTEVRKRFQKELDRYVQVAALSQEQIEQLYEGEARRGQEIGKLPPDQRQAFFGSPEGQEWHAGLVRTRALWSPIARSLAALLGRLSPQQWDRLLEQGQLVFATDPQPGELPLPAPAAETFRAARPGVSPPGERVVTGSPEGDERYRREQEAAKEQWAAATGYRVTFRLEGGLLSTWGTLRLQAEAAPVRSGIEKPAPFYHQDARLFLNAQTAEPQRITLEQTPERRARLEKDPVLGAPKLFKPETKPRPQSGGTGGNGPRFTDLLPVIAQLYDVPIIADSYSPALRFFPGELPEAGPAPLFALLDRLTSIHHQWDNAGRLIRVRSRTWFFDRPREVPLRLVRHWQAQWARAGALSLDDYLQMAALLTEAQWSGMDSLVDAGELPRELQGVSGLRHPLRLYEALSPGHRQALWQGRALPVARMTPGQRASFLALLQERSRARPTPLPLGDWPAGTLSLSSSPVKLWRDLTTEAADAGDRADSMVRASHEAVPPTASGLGTPASMPQHFSFPGRRIELHFQASPEVDERVILTVAEPS